MGAKWRVFQVWVHEQVPLNLQPLVLRSGDADFLHCWVTNQNMLSR